MSKPAKAEITESIILTSLHFSLLQNYRKRDPHGEAIKRDKTQNLEGVQWSNYTPVTKSLSITTRRDSMGRLLDSADKISDSVCPRIFQVSRHGAGKVLYLYVSNEPTEYALLPKTARFRGSGRDSLRSTPPADKTSRPVLDGSRRFVSDN